MAIKISDLAHDLGMNIKDLRKEIETRKIGVSPRASTVKDDIAYMIKDKISRTKGVGSVKSGSGRVSVQTKEEQKVADNVKKEQKKPKESKERKPNTKEKQNKEANNANQNQQNQQKKNNQAQKANQKKKQGEQSQQSSRQKASQRNDKPVDQSADKPAKKKKNKAGNKAGNKAEPENGSKMYYIEARKKKKKREEAFKKATGKTKTQLKKDQKEKRVEEEKHIPKHVELNEKMQVSEFADILGLGPGEVMQALMKNGIMMTIQDFIDFDTAAVVATELGYEVKETPKEVETAEYTLYDQMEKAWSEGHKISGRPPIISVMGHVDHGKTSLLDAVRDANVVSRESGGITQHIGAYQVVRNNKRITFLDTPGHEAFTSMRAQGAKVADVAILVVAANDSVKPQTIEAIHHAKAAEVPIIVAINKVDLEDANPEKVKADLGQYGLTPEEWGGQTIMVPISAIKREGIAELLDMVLLVSDVEDLKADSTVFPIATVIESYKDPNLGPVATVIVNMGILKVGQSFVMGDVYGKIRVMVNDKGQNIAKAWPSTPVQIAGLSDSAQAGDILIWMDDEKASRERAIAIMNERKLSEFAQKQMTARDFAKKVQSGDITSLEIIVKADTGGTVSAIKQSLGKIKSDRVALRIIHDGIGDVTESDIMMAKASNAMLLTFHVGTPSHVSDVAERSGVEIRDYSVIYKMIEDVENILRGLIESEKEAINIGRLKVLGIFKHAKDHMIVGGKVLDGILHPKTEALIHREKEEIASGNIEETRIGKEMVNEVEKDEECGILVYTKELIKEGDIIECVEYRERKVEVGYEI